MKRYIVSKDGRVVGGIEVTPATARYLESKGYHCQPA